MHLSCVFAVLFEGSDLLFEVFFFTSYGFIDSSSPRSVESYGCFAACLLHYSHSNQEQLLMQPSHLAILCQAP